MSRLTSRAYNLRKSYESEERNEFEETLCREIEGLGLNIDSCYTTEENNIQTAYARIEGIEDFEVFYTPSTEEAGVYFPDDSTYEYCDFEDIVSLVLEYYDEELNESDMVGSGVIEIPCKAGNLYSFVGALSKALQIIKLPFDIYTLQMISSKLVKATSGYRNIKLKSVDIIRSKGRIGLVFQSLFDPEDVFSFELYCEEDEGDTNFMALIIRGDIYQPDFTDNKIVKSIPIDVNDTGYDELTLEDYNNCFTDFKKVLQKYNSIFKG